MSTLKILSLRLRGMKGQLQELGEETDENVENISKMQGQILNLTKGKVNIFDGAGEFRSTYEIMKDISEVWDDLGSTAQADLLETIAGKHRANSVAALMSNWENVESAVKSATEAEGSAAKENQKYVDSVQGRLDKLTTSWQSFSESFMESDTLKGGISVLTELVNILEGLIDNFGLLGTISFGVAGKGLWSYFKGAKEAKASLNDVVDAIRETSNATKEASAVSVNSDNAEAIASEQAANAEMQEVNANQASAQAEITETTANTTSATSEMAENTANIASTESELTEIAANGASTASEVAETTANEAATISELAEATANKASAVSETEEATSSTISAQAELEESAANVTSTTTEAAEATANLSSVTAEAAESAVNAAGGFKKFASSLGGKLAIAGIAIGVISSLIQAYKNYREEISQARQESIKASDEILDASRSLEQAYIKYSGKTDLTVEEEAELESAIKGTVDALGDKSSALQGVVNSSNDYVAALERITDAELKAAELAAKEKRDNAKLELQDKVKGWTSLDGSEVSMELGRSRTENLEKTNEAIKIAKEIAGDKYFGYGTYGKDNDGKTYLLELDADASVDEALEYYHILEKIKSKLVEKGFTGSKEYDAINAVIKEMSDTVKVYEDSLYDVVKAQYQVQKGIPKTTEEYLKMRNAILNDKAIKNQSFEQKLAIANNLDSDLGQAFDLSSIEARARKFAGVIKGFGDGSIDGTNEVGTVETFLNMQTALNNEECTVGEYLSEFDNITSMAEKFSEEEREAFNLEFGLDTDKIKEQYDSMYEFLSRKHESIAEDTDNFREEYARRYYIEEYNKQQNELQQSIQSFLNSLTADELAAVVDIRTEIDWGNTSAEDIRKLIEDRVKLNEALNFNASIEVDKTALETLNTALEESVSAMGLSEESIDSLKAKYADLEGYNPHTLFEKTANGVKVNREELAKLEQKYNDLTKTEVQEHLDTLVEEYNKCTKAIDGNIGSQEKLELISKREKYAQQIEELAEYQAQLEGVTGAYQRWIDAQNTPEDYEGYQAVATGREDIEDEISRGFISNATKEYIDLLSGEDLVGGTIDDYANAWDKLDKKVGSTSYSIHDFFTVNDDGDITSTGIDRFFDGIKKDFKGEVYKLNEETGEYYYDFSQENLKAIQDEWGIGIEAIELLLEAAAAAGYDIDWGGIFEDLDIDISNFENVEAMISLAEKAQEEFNKIKGLEDVEFNFRTNNIQDATTEVEKARKAYNDLIYKDGKLNLKAEGAEQMQFMLSTLITQKQQLSTPAIMRVDTSQIDKAKTNVIDVINKAKELQTAYENYEIAISTGVDVEGAKADLNTAIDGMKDTSVDVRADLKLPTNEELTNAANGIGSIKVGATLDGTTIGNIATKIQTECTPEVIAKVTGLDQSVIEGTSQQVVYTAEHSDVDNFINSLTDISKKIIYTYETSNNKPNPSNIKRTITYKYETEGDVPEANGTANANGTTQSGRAFARGNWGIKGNGVALGGELGRELVVRDGKFFTIGDKGAEFFHYKPNDIVFNAAQTESLFKYGGIKGAKPRGKMFAEGSAFAEGKAFAWKASGSSKSSALSSLTDKVVKKVEDTVKNIKSLYSAKSSTKSESLTDISKKAQTAQNKDKNKNKNKNKDKDKFEETIDFIEIAISRIEREIDNLDQKVNNVYTSWSSRNSALSKEINKVGDEITLQQKAAQKYLQEANSVGLSESYAKKIREGSLSIEDFEGESDEKLVEKIKDYQTWYEKYLACIDATEELKERESELYAQRFEHIQARYDGILQGYEHTESMLNEYISQAEEQGHLISTKYYEALINNEKQNIAQLKNKQAALIAERDKAVADGKITKGSEAWYEQCAAIDEVTQAIEEGNTALIEYNNSIRDIDWQKFDLIQERISDITAESEFLIELMSNKDLFDDDGKLTKQGAATMGLHAQNYNVAMYQSDDYGKEVAKLDKQIAKDPYDQELINRRRELIEAQRDSILAAEDEKNAIKDLVEEGINLELDALQEKIDKKNEELEAEKDLYDYQRQVLEQTEEIASLEKQMASYSNDDSEEAKAKIQELKVSLEEAKVDLQETEWDRYIDQQSQLLDTLYTEYETILNSRLDNIDFLLQQVIDGINAAAGAEGTITSALGSEGVIATAIANAIGENGSIKGILNTELGAVGTKLSTAMNNIWSVGEGNAKSILTTYGDNFQTRQTTTNNTLNGIKASVDKMANASDKEAQKKITANKTTTSAKKDPTKDKSATTKKNAIKTNKKSNTSSGDGKAKVGDKVKFVSGQYYYDSQGKKPLGSHNRGKEVYITSINTKSWATHPYHISTGKKLGTGDLGWLKLNQLSGYATGKKKISNNEYAWTQENGQEFIVRPSDGAILTPVAKGDSVLNATASGNIWSMANNPAEFIRDNLKLDSSNIPSGANVQSNYTQNFDKVIFNMPNVKNYNELVSEMQRDPNFEKLILAMTLDQVAGKSKLAKNKAIR